MPRTALQWASLDGDALRVRWLLSSGENPNADDWVRACRATAAPFASNSLSFWLLLGSFWALFPPSCSFHARTSLYVAHCCTVAALVPSSEFSGRLH